MSWTDERVATPRIVAAGTLLDPAGIGFHRPKARLEGQDQVEVLADHAPEQFVHIRHQQVEVEPLRLDDCGSFTRDRSWHEHA